LPHGDGSDDETNLILPGEVVVIDLGARYRGYCTDLSRTFFMGEPTDEMVEVYNIVMEAQVAGYDAIRAGEMARDVDKAARDVISSYGYGDNFTHGLGHGIGLYIHMPPILSPSSNGVLFQSTDMAISVEPGIYLTGNFGVRIEDDVMVTRTGYDLITHFPTGIDEAIINSEGNTNSSEQENPMADVTQEITYPLLIGIIIILAVIISTILFKKYKRF
jgi:Xaa-Pro aminopeptidase